MCNFMTTRTSLIILILLSIFASGQDDKALSHHLITDIRKEFNIKFLADSSTTFHIHDSANYIHFLKICSNYISTQELEMLLKEPPRQIQWDQSLLKKITCINSDSVQNINLELKSKKWTYIKFITTPIFDKTQKYAIVRIFSRLPDPDGTNILYGGACSYLFCYRDKKWTIVEHGDCVDY